MASRRGESLAGRDLANSASRSEFVRLLKHWREERSLRVTMNLADAIGFDNGRAVIASADEEKRLREFVNLKLASRGYKIVGEDGDYPFLSLGRSLLAKFQEQSRLLVEHLCPVDSAITPK